MTFAAVGSPVAVAASTFTFVPSATGDFVVAEVACSSATVSATALTSAGGDITWSQLVAPTTLAANTQICTVFIGKVITASSHLVTVTFSGTAPTVRGFAQEGSSTAGFSAVTLDSSGTVNSATANYPTLTPAHGAGGFYLGFAFNSSTAVAGSTSGYTYNASVDGNGNGMCYNASCTSSAQTPVWGDSNSKSGVAVLLYEAALASAPQPLVSPSPAAIQAASW